MTQAPPEVEEHTFVLERGGTMTVQKVSEQEVYYRKVFAAAEERDQTYLVRDIREDDDEEVGIEIFTYDESNHKYVYRFVKERDDELPSVLIEESVDLALRTIDREMEGV